MLLDSPVDTVRRVLFRSDVWTRTARALGRHAQFADPTRSPVAPLADGDRIEIRPAGRARGLVLTVRTGPADPTDDRGRADRADRGDRDGPAGPVPEPLTLELAAPVGPVGRGRIRMFVAATPAGTLVTVDTEVEAGRRRTAFLAAWPVVRRRVLRAEQTLLGIMALAADEVTVVVAGAVVQDDRLLVARRTHPADLAGRWELPGGKADPGESDTAALRRELAEELGLAVDVGERIGPDIELGHRLILRCRLARPTDPGAPLRPTEHDRVRWVSAAELDGLDWLDADRALLPELRAALDPAGEAPLGHD